LLKLNKNYINHMIECQCILPIFKNKTKPLYHKFIVFSTFDENDRINLKYSICDNCKSVHKITEIQKSEILWGKEGLKSLVRSKEDIIFNFKNENLNEVINILLKNDCELNIWEQIEFIFENNLENHTTMISKEELEEFYIIKFLEYKDKKFKLKTENIEKEFKI
tara:strand:- start:942 stop:1436 length:495 start_codon:yes stop_codon:yes gene_type:complete